MLNCVIIDDEFSAIGVLSIYIKETPSLNLLYSNSNPIEGLSFINTHSEQVDLLFLDIHMEKMSGTELIKLIPNHIKTIFTTAYSEYALEAFELEAADYLMKPISYQRFIKSVNKVLKNHKATKSDHFFIHSEKKHIKINIADVLHVEGYGNFLKIYCKDKPYYLSTNTFQEIEQFLTEPDFIRINKSHIIAFSSISSVEGNLVYLLGDENGKNQQIEIPIGITYRKHFFDLINKSKI